MVALAAECVAPASLAEVCGTVSFDRLDVSLLVAGAA
jgi:hypothetical protein